MEVASTSRAVRKLTFEPMHSDPEREKNWQKSGGHYLGPKFHPHVVCSLFYLNTNYLREHADYTKTDTVG